MDTVRQQPSPSELMKLSKTELAHQLWGEIRTNIEMNSQLRAARSSSETGAGESEVAWLIERGGLCLGFCEYRFTWVTFTDEKALRFSRSVDAYSFKETMRWEQKKWEILAEAKVTEHMWAAPKETASAPQGKHICCWERENPHRCILCCQCGKKFVPREDRQS